ncbi:uncharacterized protein LOC106158771 [Lingula anatina]|uniref:Uncharacterized protein LOC106158771 n=1 Tax=Lingula anatina TaxID=7574 RepID=A0A1S3HXN7_LINAN|nr:uncharacterized protein LOC106158771 [Lingula anatina]|eukprot:XP_013390326.1 uncharacterized protein LOC106158771 [Lingula anatina]
MAQYDVPDESDLMECPYDPVHMIRAKRFPYHLMKCRKNYAGKDMKTCPFNARHVVPGPELRYHISRCPDKAMLQQDVKNAMEKEEDEGAYFKGNTSVPTYFPEWDRPEPTEDWDAETPGIPRIGVDPKELNNPTRTYIKDLVGMTPAEKKRHKNRLQRRAQRIQQGLPPDASDEEENEEKPGSQPESQPREDSPSGQLRLPKQAAQTLQMAQQSRAAVKQQGPSSVFAYSLSQAGLGRGVGRGLGNGQIGANGMVPPGFSAQNGVLSHSENAQMLANLARGRGIARGIARGSPPSMSPTRPGSTPPGGAPVFQVGRGRGILTTGQPGSPSFVVPNISQLQQQQNVGQGDQVQGQGDVGQGQNDVGQGQVPQDGDEKEETETAEVQRVKAIRKIQKKLRQIADLEAEGKELDEAQMEKVSKKVELENELQKLQMQ